MILGVDPGASGGFGLIDLNGELVEAWKMPPTERDISNGVKNRLAVIQRAYIEKVHAMPKQGVSSSFKFGMSYGGLRMLLVTLEIPFEAVTPQKWQRTLSCLTKGDKNVSKAKAQELFPTMPMTHLIADAILIAEYGRRTWQQ